MRAIDRWRSDLEAWAIPEELLDAAEESPYGWPAWVWSRISATARTAPPPITVSIAAELAGTHGSILDVGAGRGRGSLPLAMMGHPLTAVEPDTNMADGFEEEATRLGVDATLVRDRWPQASSRVPVADVVLSANVVYDVPDIGPFIAALHHAARRGVVIEVTARHPRVATAHLFRAVHGIDRPNGPSVDDLVAVVGEELGIRPEVTGWERQSSLWFASWDEALAFYGTRIALPKSRHQELRPLLESEIIKQDGRLQTVALAGQHRTLWWETGT